MACSFAAEGSFSPPTSASTATVIGSPTTSGSGSTELRKDELNELAPVHFGRKKIQPSREELKKFHRAAEPLLDHPVKWFDEAVRNVIAKAFGQAAEKHGYTLWACAICSNHGHVVARTHRDHSEVIWQRLADAARDALIRDGLFPVGHPVWSNRPYKVFLYTRPDVVGRIDCVEKNPEKEGLARQYWDFVKPYKG